MMNHKNFLKGTDLALNKDIVHFDEALKLLKKGSEFAILYTCLLTKQLEDYLRQLIFLPKLI